jgi:CheY-like chemotaxis protein
MTTSSVSFRFLVVDDMPVNRRMFEKQVELASKEAECPSVCDSAASGAEAVELCSKHEYDLVIMDYNMRGMNGGETTRKILAFSPRAHIVGCTATDKEAEIADCLDAGMEKVLPKNANVRELLVHEFEESVPKPYRKTSLG